MKVLTPLHLVGKSLNQSRFEGVPFIGDVLGLHRPAAGLVPDPRATLHERTYSLDFESIGG